MRISVIWLLCYKICSFQQFISCKPNNLWHLYGSNNQLSDRQPFPPKSIIQIQSSDQNQSNDQGSLQSDGCVVTGMKWVCGFTQGILKSTVLSREKKKTSSQLIPFSVLTDFKEKHKSEAELSSLPTVLHPSVGWRTFFEKLSYFLLSLGKKIEMWAHNFSYALKSAVKMTY